MFQPTSPTLSVITVVLEIVVLPLSCLTSFACDSSLGASISHSDGSFFLLCVPVCGPVCALVYPTVMGRSSCCVCVCVSVCGPVYALVYPKMTGSSSCCVCVCVSVCGPVCALVYPIVTGRSSCCVCLYVVPTITTINTNQPSYIRVEC
jgi:hypothetical protein